MEAKVKKVPKSRTGRWQHYASAALQALSDMEEALSHFNDAVDDLKTVQDEYSDWKDNLPDNMQSGTVADKLSEIVDNLDIEGTKDTLESAINEARDVLESAEQADLPMGFGRD